MAIVYLAINASLQYILDNIFIRFGYKLYRQIVGTPMDTYWTPPVADLFLCCYERDVMLCRSDKNQAYVIIEAFNVFQRCIVMRQFYSFIRYWFLNLSTTMHIRTFFMVI